MIGRDADRPRAGPRQAHLVDREGRVERFSARRGNRRPRIFFSAQNWEGGLTRARATIGRGQDLDRLTTRRGCRRASWSRPSTRSPGRSTRGGCRSVRTRANGRGAGPRHAHHAAGVADVHPGRGPRHVPWSMLAGSFTRPGCRSVRTRATRPRAGPRQAHHAAGLPTCILVEALDTLPWSIDTRRLPIGADPGDGRGQTLDRLTTRPVADVHPGRGPRHAPLVDADTRRVADRCRTRATAAGKTSTRSPRGRVADVHPGRGPRHAPLVDAGGELHAAGLPNSADRPGDRPRAGPRQVHHAAGCRRASWSRPSTRSPGRSTRGGCRSVWTRATAAGQDLDTLTTRPVADVHPGRGSRHAPPVDRHAAGLPIGADPGDGRGQDLDTLTTRPGCRRASWSRPSTGSPGRCRRGASRGRVADRCGPERRPRAGPRQAHHAAGLPTCILVEALDRFPWSMPAGSFTRPGCRSVRTPGRTAAGRTSTGSPRGGAADVHPGRGPRHAPPVDAGGKLHAAGLPIGADRPGDGRGQDLDTLTTRPGCRRASWSRPSTRSPGRCRRGASRGRVADRCGPGPADRPRAGPRQAHHAAGLPTCILVEALDTLPRSIDTRRLPIGADPGERPRAGPRHAHHAAGCRRASWSRPSTRSPGRSTRGGCRSVRTTGRRPRARPRHAPARPVPTSILVEALDTLPWSMLAGSFTRPGCRTVWTRATAAGKTSTGSPRGRLPTCILVEALDTLPWSIDTRRLPIGADPGDGRGQDLDRLPRGRAADVHPGRGPRHVPPGRCRRGASRGRVADVIRSIDTRPAPIGRGQTLDRLTTRPGC